MQQILYIADPSDPLTARVKAEFAGVSDAELVVTDSVPGALNSFSAMVIGDIPLGVQLDAASSDVPEFVQLTRGHHANVDAASLVSAGVTVAGSGPVLAPYVARHAMSLAAVAVSGTQSAVAGNTPTAAEIVNNIHNAINGKTVGIVGFGRVGMATAELCARIGANVVFCDVRTPPHGSTKAAGLRRTTLDMLLSRADIVSLHVQWGPTSNPLIAERELKLMSAGSILVNTADARLVDTRALSKILKAAEIKVALDIEGLEDSELADAPVSAWTPYVAARSDQADDAVARFVTGNVRAALSDGEPAGLIEIVDYPPIGDPAFWSSKMAPRRG